MFMNNTLKPYTEFDTDELACTIHELVKDKTTYLRSRRLLGVIARYGATLDTAKAKIDKGQRETQAGTLRHFVIIDAEDAIAGQAAYFPGLQLTRSLVLFNPRYLPGFSTKKFPHANPNISAWDADGDTELLTDAYTVLRTMASQPIPATGIRDIAWTIEPITSPRYVHQAIIGSGLTRVATRSYYDGESNVVSGLSTLYADTSTWSTSVRRHNELVTGNWSGSEEEIISRNPIGM